MRTYKYKLSFMTNAEILREYESVYELSRYSQDYFNKLKIVERELIDRGLHSLIS